MGWPRLDRTKPRFCSVCSKQRTDNNWNTAQCPTCMSRKSRAKYPEYYREKDKKRWRDADLAYGPQSAIIRWHGKPIAKEKRAWGLVVKGAGLGDDVTPHVMRHTATTWLLQEGMELWDISGLVGTSIKTIEAVYGHQDSDYQLAASQAFGRKRA